MARSVAGKSRERVSASRSESSIDGPSAGGEVNGSLLPDVGICRWPVFSSFRFLRNHDRMADDPVVRKMRALFNEFKRPYLLESTEGENENDPTIQNTDILTKVEEHIGNLFNIVSKCIVAGGKGCGGDDNERAVHAVFEKRGIYPALRANPELKEPMLYYAKLDLRTYPYTFNPGHIDELNTNMVESNTVIVPNTVIISDKVG